MKIVLVQPKSFHTWEALNIGYLASYLKAHGYTDVDFYSGFFDSDEEIIQGCRGADLIGFSCTSPQFNHGLALARRVKTPDNYIVFGGFHSSALPQDVLEHPCIDAVVAGEGEEAFLDIARGNRERIVRKPMIQDLDSIPFPDRKVMKQERNLQRSLELHGRRIAAIFSTRGCPFRCTFCASHAVWTRTQRQRSPENVMEEFLQVVRDCRADFITFADDEVGIKPETIMEFSELKVRKGEKTPWGCNVVASTLTHEMLKVMRAANCQELWIGVESGSPRIMKDTRKPISVDRVKKAFRMAKDLGFVRRAYFLLGMPGESHEDIRLSEALIDEIEPDVVGFTILAPYPGTAYYNPELHKDVDWSQVDEYQNELTSTRFLSNEDLRREQDRLVEKYRRILTFRQKKAEEPAFAGTAPDDDRLPGRSGL